MKGSFLRFKKRIYLLAIVRSLMISLSVGFLALAVLLVLDKRGIWDMGVPIAVLISVGALLLSLGLCLLIFIPSEKRAASFLDRELSLGARVRTMLEFSEHTGGMYELQREDTESRLSAIPTGAVGFKRAWIFILVLAVSLSLFGSSFAVPALADPPTEEETVDDYERDFRVAALLALIERIEADGFATPEMKTELISVIEALIAVVEATDKEAVMRKGAVASVLTVDSIRRSYVTAIHYAELLTASERSDFLPLASALTDFDDGDFTDALE